MSPEQRKNFMITYLKLKVEEQDWHGVADAAMDLREIEVELILRTGLTLLKSDLGEA